MNDKCLLTGKTGKFVDSHLIPKALQHQPELGASMLQLASKFGPTKVWSSWYDKTIVTADGETILAKYDDAAIRILRNNKMVWSGWGDEKSLTAEGHIKFPNSPLGIRMVDNIEVEPLRLFFLSILWRAAVSQLDGFQEIEIGENDLNELTRMVRDGKDDGAENFPVCFTQLSTIGDLSNQTPFREEKIIPSLDGKTPEGTYPIFRFYFNGLVVHFGTKLNDKEHYDRMGPMALGSGTTVVFPTVEHEASFQKENEDAVLMGALLSNGRDKVDRYFEDMKIRREKAGKPTK